MFKFYGDNKWLGGDSIRALTKEKLGIDLSSLAIFTAHTKASSFTIQTKDEAINPGIDKHGVYGSPIEVKVDPKDYPFQIAGNIQKHIAQYLMYSSKNKNQLPQSIRISIPFNDSGHWRSALVTVELNNVNVKDLKNFMPHVTGPSIARASMVFDDAAQKILFDACCKNVKIGVADSMATEISSKEYSDNIAEELKKLRPDLSIQAIIIDSPQQKDGFSCAIFATENAMAFIETGKPCVKEINIKEQYELLDKIQERKLSSQNKETEQKTDIKGKNKEDIVKEVTDIDVLVKKIKIEDITEQNMQTFQNWQNRLDDKVKKLGLLRTYAEDTLKDDTLILQIRKIQLQAKEKKEKITTVIAASERRFSKVIDSLLEELGPRRKKQQLELISKEMSVEELCVFNMQITNRILKVGQESPEGKVLSSWKEQINLLSEKKKVVFEETSSRPIFSQKPTDPQKRM